MRFTILRLMLVVAATALLLVASGQPSSGLTFTAIFFTAFAGPVLLGALRDRRRGGGVRSASLAGALSFMLYAAAFCGLLWLHPRPEHGVEAFDGPGLSRMILGVPLLGALWGATFGAVVGLLFEPPPHSQETASNDGSPDEQA